MARPFALSFPCFVLRRDDEPRCAVVSLPAGEQAIAILTDPNLVQMFVFEHCFEPVPHRPLPVNTPAGLARILEHHLPEGVTHVVFNPNGVEPCIERASELLRLLKQVVVTGETDEE
jgi:hypothetical protein